jgi:hypothetical protein
MTLPALPLYEDTTLPDRSMILLSLAWLRGGSVLDYIHLDVSESVLLSMLLQAASENTPHARLMKGLAHKSQGFREGLEKGREIYQ